MSTIVAVANQKGGVGKTTTTVNLAAFCALSGKQTLIVDADPQGNASSVFAPDYDGPSVFGEASPIESSLANLSILPSSGDLNDEQTRLAKHHQGRLELRTRLQRYAEQYDIILIDCPPSLNILPLNALLAADRLLIPIQCEYYAMEGLGQILGVLQTLDAEGYDPPAGLSIILTMFERGLGLAGQVEAEIRHHFGEVVLQSTIPRDGNLAVAPSHGRSILDHDPLCEGAIAYLAATREFLNVIR